MLRCRSRYRRRPPRKRPHNGHATAGDAQWEALSPMCGTGHRRCARDNGPRLSGTAPEWESDSRLVVVSLWVAPLADTRWRRRMSKRAAHPRSWAASLIEPNASVAANRSVATSCIGRERDCFPEQFTSNTRTFRVAEGYTLFMRCAQRVRSCTAARNRANAKRACAEMWYAATQHPRAWSGCPLA